MAASDPQRIDVESARREIAGDSIAVDVRSAEEFQEGHVPGAIHLPDGDPGAGTKEPAKGARLVVIAEDGEMAARAAGKLSDHGYEALALDGGMDDWTSEDFNIQPTADPDKDSELGAG